MLSTSFVDKKEINLNLYSTNGDQIVGNNYYKRIQIFTDF